jgi:hypothetical protein
VCKESLFREAAKRRLDNAIPLARARVDGRRDVLAAYDRLLAHVRRVSAILARRTRCSERRVDVNKALLALALHHADWRAPVEAWAALSESPWRELASLAAHLLARFAMPRFLASAFCDGAPGQRLPQHEWYKRLGDGDNIRHLGLPMRITRAMAHAFMQSPDHLTMVAALRRAQVLTLGGSEALARTVMATRIGRGLEHEDFWETVVRFFVNHPELDLVHVGPIVDYLQHQKFQPRRAVTPDNSVVLQPPPWPSLTMKGRSPAALLRLVDAWHAQLAFADDRVWPRARVADWQWSEPAGERRKWRIFELCSSAQLVLEGQRMRHCVATYIEACVRRRTSIWSMQRETDDGWQRALTIELDLPTRTIRQARRKCNARPNAVESALLLRWAARENLSLAWDCRALLAS